ncbi:hypothetical protein C2I18_21885 [Paenibacillus sp. PK3_47]|nr:hypothetical protein C2I18_21885 [Paenibacillus sp. PK3_47]
MVVSDPLRWLSGTAITLAGLPVYYVLTRRKHSFSSASYMYDNASLHDPTAVSRGEGRSWFIFDTKKIT